MATHERAVSLYRPAEVSILFRLLRLCEKLLRVAAYFFLAWRHVLGFLAGFEDDRGRANFRKSESCGNEHKESTNSEIHGASQGN